MKRLVLSIALVFMVLGMVLNAGAGKLGLTKEQLMIGMGTYFPNMVLDTKPKCPFIAGTYSANDSRKRARYLINMECPWPGEKIESPGIESIMLYVPIRKEWSENEQLPYKNMLTTALKNAVPEWTNDNERNEWLTKTIASLIETADPKYSDITDLKVDGRSYGRKRINVSISAGIKAPNNYSPS